MYDYKIDIFKTFKNEKFYYFSIQLFGMELFRQYIKNSEDYSLHGLLDKHLLEIL